MQIRLHCPICMEYPKLFEILEANIDTYWREFNLSEFDQMLAELEKGGRLTTAERESLLLYLGLKKIGKEPKEDGDASALPS